MKIRILVLMVFFVMTSFMKGYGQASCDELVKFRDVKLINTWEKLHDQIVFNNKQLSDYNKWKSDLESDYNEVQVGTLLAALKGISNLITNTFEVVTPTGKVISIAKGFSPVTLTKLNTTKAITGGINDVQTLYDKGILTVIRDAIISKVPVFGDLYLKIESLVEDVNDLQDFINSKSEIVKMLKDFDSLIAHNNELVKQSENDMKTFNNYLNYITVFLNDNCD